MIQGQASASSNSIAVHDILTYYILLQLTAEYHGGRSLSRYVLNTGPTPLQVQCILRYENRNLAKRDRFKLLYETPGEELAPEYYPICRIDERQPHVPEKLRSLLPEVGGATNKNQVYSLLFYNSHLNFP